MAARRSLPVRPALVVRLVRRRRLQTLLCFRLDDRVKARVNLHCRFLSQIQSPLRTLSLYRAPSASIDRKLGSASAHEHEFQYPLQRLLRSPSFVLCASVKILMPGARGVRKWAKDSGNPPRARAVFVKGEVIEVLDSIILYRSCLHRGRCNGVYCRTNVCIIARYYYKSSQTVAQLQNRMRRGRQRNQGRHATRHSESTMR